MTSLVSDFFINPVLRQARRFSRSNPQDLTRDTVTNQRTIPDSSHDTAIEDIAEDLSLDEAGAGEIEGAENISGTVLTSSPIAEDGGLEEELQSLEAGGSLRGVASFHPTNGVPLQVSSLRRISSQVDHDVSDNPSFGVPGRFRTSSATSSIFSHRSRNFVNSTIDSIEGPSRRSTQGSGQSMSNNHHRTSSLPEDDGMGPLRQQIIHIQSMDISAEQKAHMMHSLLTQEYSQAQEIFNAKHQPLAPPPASIISQERPTTPGSLSSFIWQINGSPESVVPEAQHTFRLSPDDLEPTYIPTDSPEIDESCDVILEEPVLGCRHYKRNVKLQCSACDRWYTCRLCHDEAENHILNRKATKNMLCMLCGYAQRAGEFCAGCGERTAWYYCSVCKLWDNDATKSIYHCNDCGICRKGRGLGKDFFHCKTCGTCMPMSMEYSHKCIERVSDCDCPICGEYMFTSPSPVVFMLCGHSIHRACYDEHMKTSYKCPICSKSTVNMETQFRNLDRAITEQPMPPQFQDTKAMVSCNDCYAKSAVQYHWLGLKCAICDSYNTAQLSILSDPGEASVSEGREIDITTPPDHGTGESSASIHSPPPMLARHRRHSTHVHTSSSTVAESNHISLCRPQQRLGRSVSPVRGAGFFTEPMEPNAMETDDSADEDDLDFWGRDEPRSVTSAKNIGDEMEEDGDSEEDSGIDDCEEDGDEEDQFELFGHR